MSNWNNVGTVKPVYPHTINIAVFIGRMQPLTTAHLAVMNRALELSDTLLILLGSAGEPRSLRNFLTYEERRELILQNFTDDEQTRILIQPLYDYTYDDATWTVEVQKTVGRAIEYFDMDSLAKIALIGHSKDRSSYYLKKFPQWAAINVVNYHGISATPYREKFFDPEAPIDPAWVNTTETIQGLPSTTVAYLEAFRQTEPYTKLVERHRFITKYKSGFASLPYPPKFVTVDAAVFQSGHVLMIQRKAEPGAKLWALPGGFLDDDESIDSAVYRELYEETSIKVPEAVLRGSKFAEKVFDDPFRSERGRTITHAYGINLKDDVVFPKVKGSNDPDQAVMNIKWWPISEITRDICFDDHFYIIMAFLKLL